MSKKQIQARLQVCCAMKDKDATRWEHVMFSNESTFQQVQDCGYSYVQHPVGKRLNPKYRNSQASSFRNGVGCNIGNKEMPDSHTWQG